MGDKDKKQLEFEIRHIFESGENELRIYDMVVNFIEKRYENPLDKSIEQIAEEMAMDKYNELAELLMQSDSVEASVWMIRDFVKACQQNLEVSERLYTKEEMEKAMLFSFDTFTVAFSRIEIERRIERYLESLPKANS